MIVFLYYILLSILYILSLPFLLILSFTKDKYRQSIKARFFLYKNKLKKSDIHFHVCSFGEARSIKKLSSNFEDKRITCITQTGFLEAKTFCKNVSFLAFEIFIPFWFSPCKVLVIFEAELWLMLIFVAKLRGAKVILLNARLSDKSFHRYKRFSFFYKTLFSYIDEVFAQSALDKQRLEEIGAKNVIEYFNIKAALSSTVQKIYKKVDKKIILFASTHDKEEELLLNFFKPRKDEILIIAPRHPERFEKVEEFCKDYSKKYALSFDKFSNYGENFNSDKLSSVFLLDTLNELVNFYSIADIVVLCGSFIKGVGGHNPIEVAQFNKILISGPYIHNQVSLFSMLDNAYICYDIPKLREFIDTCDKAVSLKFKPNLNLITDHIKALL